MKIKIKVIILLTILFSVFTITPNTLADSMDGWTHSASQLPPPENQRCQTYASDAVDQYRQMLKHPKCKVKLNARWQPYYQNHYTWCLTAKESALRSETKARSDHLYACGAQFDL